MKKQLLLWHPRVHEFYNESLYYFALRFRGYNRSLYVNLKEELIRHGIIGICLYEIFGSYDVLLRVWLTPRLQSAIVRILSTSQDLILHSVFRVDNQRHWAFLQEPDESVLAEVITERTYVTDIQKHANQGKQNALSRYVDSHVIAFRDEEKNSNFKEKFYSALSFSRGGGSLSISDRKEVSKTLFEIQTESSEKDSPIVQMSVYLGEGELCQALIKGLCNNGLAARDFIVDTLMERLRSYSPESTTFVIGERNPYEKDVISDDALSSFLTGTPPLWIDSWFDNFYRLGSDGQLLLDVTAELSRFRESITQSISTENRQSIIRPFLEGVLTDNPDIAISPILMWFTHFESILKKNWLDFFRASSGLEGAEAANSERDFRKDLNLLNEQVEERNRTLGDWLNMYYSTLKQYNPESELLKITPQLAEIAKLRNDFVHGEMFGGKLTQDWKRVLSLLVWGLPWYEGLKKLILTSQIKDKG